MGKRAQFNMLINSGEAHCSHGDDAGKSILDKRRIEEDWNEELKDAHVPKLKKPKQAPFHILKKSGESINPDCNESRKRILGKSIIEEDYSGPAESTHIPKLQKPIRPSAVRDFPLGCGRYASPVAPGSYISLPQSRDYISGYDRNVPPVTKEQQCPAPNSHTNGVKESTQQFSKLNYHSTAKESVKFRANLDTNCVKQEDGASSREKKNMLSCRPILKESSYLSQHSSQIRYKSLQHSKVGPKTGNINQPANMIKKEASPGHSTVEVEGLCSQHNTNENNKLYSYKIVKTAKELLLKIVRTRTSDQLSPPKSVTNTPKLAPSKAMSNAVPIYGERPSDQLSPPKFVTNAPKLAPSKAMSNAVSIYGERPIRSKVRETLRSFQAVCRKILQNQEARDKDPAQVGKRFRVDLMASKLLKDNNMFVNTGKQIVGAVPGVEVGDQFNYRIELCIVGLHRQVQAGIDFLKRGNVKLATSIVASGGYEDDLDSGDVLVYTGQGGNNYSGDKRQSEHQKLERGNLALKNNIDEKIPVRVIRGFKQKHTGNQGERKSTVNVIYTYDGLYDVEKFWLDNGASGYSVFKFQLRRQSGQPELGFKTVQFARRTNKSSVREGLRLKDISGGKERKCICAVNTVDEENGPPQFVYTTKVIYPLSCQPMPHKGCDCRDGCLNPSKCSCALKNGGEFPFNYDGAIVRSKQIVYECGPSCRCPPTCHNRVSQHGVRYNLEVFKTDKRGWGVRSSDSIPSGSFICEYTGKLLSDTEAEQCVGNDEYLFDIGRNCTSKEQSLWTRLSTLMPEIEADADCDMVDDMGFTVDAANYGNVGRFVNHSCSPNLYAQNVLYDHDDRKLPHIMLFAAENIPPMRELFYHYNYNVDQVCDSSGNIKKKACYCGSSECIGRMY